MSMKKILILALLALPTTNLAQAKNSELDLLRLETNSPIIIETSKSSYNFNDLKYLATHGVLKLIVDSDRFGKHELKRLTYFGAKLYVVLSKSSLTKHEIKYIAGFGSLDVIVDSNRLDKFELRFIAPEVNSLSIVYSKANLHARDLIFINQVKGITLLLNTNQASLKVLRALRKRSISVKVFPDLPSTEYLRYLI